MKETLGGLASAKYSIRIAIGLDHLTPLLIDSSILPGNLVDWWASSTASQFEAKAQCMVRQYSAYKPAQAGGVAVDGFNTQGENIADNGGFKQAYNAYSEFELVLCGMFGVPFCTKT